MTAILGMLFLLAHLREGKGKEKSRLEVIYYGLLFKHKSDPNKRDEIEIAGTAYGKILGKNELAIKEMISKDLSW